MPTVKPVIKQGDLKYHARIDGHKPHFIFKQDPYYFLLTEMDAGTHGNFLAINQSEVDRVAIELISNNIPSVFHCDDIHKFIHGMNLDVNKGDRTYRISRLFNICYILVANKLLRIEKEGNAIYFRKTSSQYAPSTAQPTAPKQPATPLKSNVPPKPAPKSAPSSATTQPTETIEDLLKRALQVSKKTEDDWVLMGELGVTLMQLSPNYKKLSGYNKLHLLVSAYPKLIEQGPVKDAPELIQVRLRSSR